MPAAPDARAGDGAEARTRTGSRAAADAARGDGEDAQPLGFRAPGLRVADYRNLGAYQFLAGARLGQAPVKSTRYAAILRLPEGPELLRLLEEMYDRSATVAHIAEDMHVHRSSVYNKLARVRRAIGADPLSGAARLELHLALKAARWEGRPRL
ncbi:helix-turn-helix domain-containing protein [Arthrobacter sp. UM1]|nr:helix-turn-helix domain-containing protein [Arthrobacter sp. UM1]